MIIRNKTALVFFTLSLLFAVISMPYGAAINKGKLERTATAKVVDDEYGILKLKGFDQKMYNMNGSYASFGKITNNTSQSLTVTVTIQPDFKFSHPRTRFGVKIGSEVSEFRFVSSAAKEITLSLSPGQSVDVKGFLKQNRFSVLSVAFQFTVKDASGSFSMQLGDTEKSPRHITCY